VTHYWDTTACACKCRPETCPEGQFWSQDNCACVCNIEDCAPQNLADPDNTYFFNLDSCTCECSQKSCPAGEYWSTARCECRKYPTACPGGQSWSVDDNQCACTPITCEDGYIFERLVGDPLSCGCVCMQKICPSGFFFAPEGCECRPFPQSCPLN
jgi:hypothetical protein